MSEKIKVGNAEIEKINYDYFSLLYSKMPKEYVVADLVSKCENYDELYKSYEKTQIELRQKENIIKEVREYIKEKYIEDYSHNDNYIPLEKLNLKNCNWERSLQVLEILDKVEENK